MPKNDKNKEKDKKKLKDLSVNDLQSRKINKNAKLSNLQDKKKQADTPEEKKAIQEKIDATKQRIEKIGNVVTNKKEEKQTHIPTEEELLAKIYNSPEFLNLSKENQQLISGIVDSYTVEQLQELNPSKKEMKNIVADATNAAKKQFKGDKKKLDLDHEQALKLDIDSIEKLIEQEKQRFDENMAIGNQVDSEAIKLNLTNLQAALDEASSQYEVEAQRKNDYLQTQLGDIQYALDTAVADADEDKILELRRYERLYKQNLRAVQDNMSQRGLVFSGIRFRAEDEEAEAYEDNRTTAEIEADRKKELAQRTAMEDERDIRTFTQQELDDLLTNYGVNQRKTFEQYEGVVGTGDIQNILATGNYGKGGIDPNSYLTGGLEGTISTVAQERNLGYQRAYEDAINSGTYGLTAFESKYGTKALRNEFGQNIGFTDGYGGYDTIGGIKGSETTQYNRDIAKLKQERTLGKKQGIRLGKQKKLNW